MANSYSSNTRPTLAVTRPQPNSLDGGTLLDHQALLSGIVGVALALIFADPGKREQLGNALFVLVKDLDRHLRAL
jgi:hypothetical protein